MKSLCMLLPLVGDEPLSPLSKVHQVGFQLLIGALDCLKMLECPMFRFYCSYLTYSRSILIGFNKVSKTMCQFPIRTRSSARLARSGRDCEVASSNKSCADLQRTLPCPPKTVFRFLVTEYLDNPVNGSRIYVSSAHIGNPFATE